MRFLLFGGFQNLWSWFYRISGGFSFLGGRGRGRGLGCGSSSGFGFTLATAYFARIVRCTTVRQRDGWGFNWRGLGCRGFNHHRSFGNDGCCGRFRLGNHWGFGL